MSQEHSMCFWKDFKLLRKVQLVGNESYSTGVTCRNRNGEKSGLCNCHTSLYFLSIASCGRAAKAPKLLKEDINKFDPVVNDVDMLDMDGFILLERVGLEMDLPIINEFVS